MTRFIDQAMRANLKTGEAALQACGMQPEFARHLRAQASVDNTCIILRAGSPPVYNQHRGPKSGVNLSKTSNHGLFRGSLAAEVQFTRVNADGQNLGYHAKDSAHLELPPTHVDYQHCMQLSITMQDLIREVRPQGDLHVLGYDEESGQLRLEYKPGKGPANFKGQFVLNLKEGDTTHQVFSRPWDQPKHDPAWDSGTGVIKKPKALAAIPDKHYQQIFNQSFAVSYTREKLEAPKTEDLIAAQVMANKPRTAIKFLEAMGSDHPHYHEVAHFTKLSDILDNLSAEEILEIYDRTSLIVTGDWDGLSLGHPPGLNKEYSQVYNTFDTVNAHLGMAALMAKTTEYFDHLKSAALTKSDSERSEFEKIILTINELPDIISDFALSRAGCITPYEFLYQQVINYAYRTPTNAFYGKKYDMAGLQHEMDKTLRIVNALPEAQHSKTKEQLITECIQQSEKVLDARGKEQGLSYIQRQKSLDHFKTHLRLAIDSGKLEYQIPHPDHDPNVHDLFQHGFENNNPYGCNYEGAWILVTPEGVIHGEKQEQLCKLLLLGDFLKENIITVSWGADMKAGWAKVISKQIELGQAIPPKTMEKYEAYQKSQKNQAAPRARAHSLETELRLTTNAQLVRGSSSSQLSSLKPLDESILNKKPLQCEKRRTHHLTPLETVPETPTVGPVFPTRSLMPKKNTAIPPLVTPPVAPALPTSSPMERLRRERSLISPSIETSSSQLLFRKQPSAKAQSNVKSGIDPKAVRDQTRYKKAMKKEREGIASEDPKDTHRPPLDRR